jgi:cell division protease FtsH
MSLFLLRKCFRQKEKGFTLMSISDKVREALEDHTLLSRKFPSFSKSANLLYNPKKKAQPWMPPPGGIDLTTKEQPVNLEEYAESFDQLSRVYPEESQFFKGLASAIRSKDKQKAKQFAEEIERSHPSLVSNAVWQFVIAAHKEASLSLQQALERAKGLSDANQLSQEDYQSLLQQMDKKDHYPFSMALLEHSISVKTGAVNVVDSPVEETGEPVGEISWQEKYPESEEQQEQSGQSAHDPTHLDRHSQLANELLSAYAAGCNKASENPYPNSSTEGLDPAQLAKGQEIEQEEHPEVPIDVARQLVIDHLRNDPDTYEKEEKMLSKHVSNNPNTPPSQEALKFQCSDRRVEGDKVFCTVTWNPDDVHAMGSKAIEQRVKSFVQKEINQKSWGFSGGLKVESINVSDGTAEVSYKSSEDAAPQLSSAHSAPITVKQAVGELGQFIEKATELGGQYIGATYGEVLNRVGRGYGFQFQDESSAGKFAQQFPSTSEVDEGSNGKWNVYVKIGRRVGQGGFEPGSVSREDKLVSQDNLRNQSYKDENAFEDADMKLGDAIQQKEISEEETSMKEALEEEPFKSTGPLDNIEGNEDPKVETYTPQAIHQLGERMMIRQAVRMAKAAKMSKIAQFEPIEKAAPQSNMVDYFFDKLKQASENQVGRSEKLRAVVEDFLGVGATDICVVKKGWASFLKPMVCLAFSETTKSFDSVEWLKEHKYGQDLASDFIPDYSDIVVGLHQTANVSTSQSLFLRSKKGNPIFVEANLEGGWSGLSIMCQVAKNDKHIAQNFIHAVEHWMSRNNIYKNKLLAFEAGNLNFLETTKCSWSDVILPPDIIKQVRQSTVDMLKRRAVFFDTGLGVRRSILLDGPPGVGKTQVNRALSSEVYSSPETTATVIWVSAKSIEDSSEIRQLYDAARSLSPTLLLMEDVDLIGKARGSYGTSHLLGELLTQMDGAEDNSGLITIATTNDLASIDYALTSRPGRFDRLIPIPLPGKEARSLMLSRFVQVRKAGLSKEASSQDFWESLLTKTEGFTGAYLSEVVNTAVIEAVNSDSLTSKKRPLLSKKHIAEAVDTVRKNFRIGNAVNQGKAPDRRDFVAEENSPCKCASKPEEGGTHKSLDVVKKKNKKYNLEEMSKL